MTCMSCTPSGVILTLFSLLLLFRSKFTLDQRELGFGSTTLKLADVTLAPLVVEDAQPRHGVLSSLWELVLMAPQWLNNGTIMMPLRFSSQPQAKVYPRLSLQQIADRMLLSIVIPTTGGDKEAGPFQLDIGRNLFAVLTLIKLFTQCQVF